eukprot:416685-Amphidinium_carterae.1
MAQQKLTGFLVDQGRARETRQHRDAQVAFSNHERRAQAESLGFRWPEPNRGRGKPSRQQLYAARLYRHIRECDLPDGATAAVPPWWKPGDAVVASDATLTAVIE